MSNLKKLEQEIEILKKIEQEGTELIEIYDNNGNLKERALLIKDENGLKKKIELTQKQIEAIRKFNLVREYREKGRAKKKFVQAMPKFEEEVLGKVTKRELTRLMLTLPYIQYTNKEEENKAIQIKKGKNALVDDFAILWNGLDKRTVEKELANFVEKELFELLIENGKTVGYKVNDIFFLKGLKGEKEIKTKKVVLDKLSSLITKIDEEVLSYIRKEERRPKNRKRYRSRGISPLALLAILLAKTHYKTFFVLKNHNDVIIDDGIPVKTALKNKRKIRELKFHWLLELRNLYFGNVVKKQSSYESNEIKDCLEILERVGALHVWKWGKTPMIIMNPALVFVSPNIKCDNEWKEQLQTIFDIAEIIE